VEEVFPPSTSLYDIRNHLRRFYDEFVHLVKRDQPSLFES
jgi:hypothetical protein